MVSSSESRVAQAAAAASDPDFDLKRFHGDNVSVPRGAMVTFGHAHEGNGDHYVLIRHI